jgi:hypothetical protein
VPASKYSANQIIKFEHDDEVDNDSQNDISPALVDVSGENDENLSNCESTKATENDAETHSNGAKKSNNHQTAKKYSCPECKKTYSTQRALFKHKNNKHPKNQDATKFSCAHCVKKYHFKSSLLRHIKIALVKCVLQLTEVKKTFLPIFRMTTRIIHLFVKRVGNRLKIRKTFIATKKHISDYYINVKNVQKFTDKPLAFIATNK